MESARSLLFSILVLVRLLVTIWVAGIGYGATRKPTVAPPSSYALQAVDFPHNTCDAPIDLNVGRDYFTPIVNELPGKEEYNRLVSAFERRDWIVYDKELEPFKKRFEASPLIEPTIFLSVQVELERLRSMEQIAEVEKHFRELLLLYPKSQLVPVLTASVAHYFLDNKKFERSLSLYENARIQFDESPLACVFLMGTAEAQYQMNELQAVKPILTKIIERCMNRRIRSAALLRQLDIDLREKRSVETSRYEEILSVSPLVVEQHYPWVLHNIGERYYQAREFGKAKFYFENYLRQGGAVPGCSAAAQKRIGDILLRTSRPLSEITGQYYKAVEFDKDGPLTVFTYLHALLVGYSKVSVDERRLRMEIFDREVVKIADASKRTLAFLEKGIAALEAREGAAIGYLTRFEAREREAGGLRIDQGAIAESIRSLFKEALVSISSESSELLLELSQSLPEAYRIWGGQDSKELCSGVYRKVLENLVKAGDIQRTSEFIDYWTQGPFWTKSVPEDLARRISEILWTNFKARPGAMASVWVNRDRLKPFVPKEKTLFWYALALRNGDSKEMTHYENEISKRSDWLWAPSPTAQPGKPPSMDAPWEMIRGHLLERINKLKEASQLYAKIKDPKYASETLTRRFAIARTLGDLMEVLELGGQLVRTMPPAERQTYLSIVVDQLRRTEKWKEALRWTKRTAQLMLSDAEAAEVSYLAARAAFELKDCGEAVGHYRTAIGRAPEHAEAGEAFFKLGKCLTKMGRSDEAKEVWGGLIQRKDGFWSPVAENELNLINRQPASEKK